MCEEQRRLAALLAIELSGRRAVVEEVARLLGVSAEGEAAGRIEGVVVGPTSFGWSDPELRENALAALPPADRRIIHEALSRSSLVDDRERAHYLVQASTAPDNRVAEALTAIARVVSTTVGPAAAVEIFHDAASFASNPTVRTDLLCDAGVSALQSNDLVQARSHLEACLQGTVTDATATRAILALGATLAWGVGPSVAADRMRSFAAVVADRGEPTGLYLAAAASFEVMSARLVEAHRDAVLARASSTDPIAALLSTSVWVQTIGIRLPDPTLDQQTVEKQLDEASMHAAALMPVLEASLSADVAGIELPAHQIASFALAMDRSDDARRLLARLTASFRRRGLVGSFGATLEADLLWRTGRWTEAAELLAGKADEEYPGLARAATQAAAARISAFRGDPATPSLAEAALAVCRPAGAGLFEAWAFWGLAVHAASLGDDRWAVECHERICSITRSAGSVQPGALWFVPDYVEALVRLGDHARAARVAAAFAVDAERSASRWGGAAARRVMGMVGPDDDDALRQLQLSIGTFTELGYPFERARSLLALAERYAASAPTLSGRARREARRVFVRLGAAPWIPRCDGVDAASRGDGSAIGPWSALTPAELRVAEAAVHGGTTSELAAQLFVSPKTIESHLGSAYRKLGVANRSQLVAAMLGVPPTNRGGGPGSVS